MLAKTLYSSDMRNRLAIFISGLTSPFLVTTVFGLLVVHHATEDTGRLVSDTFLFIACITLPPLATILIGIRTGSISDIHVAVREQRAIPYLSATVGALVLTAMYAWTGAPRELVALAVAMTVTGVVFGILSEFWKLSVHVASFVGGVLVAAFLVQTDFLWLLLAFPIVVWARLIRKRHTLAEVAVASVLIVLCLSITLAVLH